MKNLEELVRYLCMRFLLVPAARVLPKTWALRIADVLSLLLLTSPRTGPRLYWSMRRVYGRGRRHSLKLTWDWLGRGYRDFVIARRILSKREDLYHWKIIERNSENIDSVRRSGESYIVATGHFSMATSYAMYSPTVTPGRVVRVSMPVQSPLRNLETRRLDYQFGWCLRAAADCWGRQPEIVFVGSDPRGAKTIYDRLCERGNAVFIDVDAMSGPGAYERPFAGHRSRTFATGAAQLARMANCCVITCVHFVDSNGAIVLEWGTPLRVSGNDRHEHHMVMNRILDQIETAVGERPEQYALDAGKERLWDPQTKQWKV